MNIRRNKSEQLKKMKAIIRQLKFKLEDLSKSEVSLSKYNKVKDSLKQAMLDNQMLNDTIMKLKDHADELTQKKNRLNFLIFLWMKEGYPINKIYQNEVKPIDSHRFNVLTPTKFKNSMKKLNEKLKLKKQWKSDEKSKINNNILSKNLVKDSFDWLPESFFDENEESQLFNKSQEIHHDVSINLNDSYEPIAEGPAKIQNKPLIVPTLDFNKLEQYNNAIKKAKKKQIEDKSIKAQAENFDEIESILSHAVDTS